MPIRSAAGGDARAIAEVQVESWRAAYRGLLPETYLADLSVERRTAAWEGILSRAESETLVAVAKQGEVVGFASLGPSRDSDAPEETGELLALYVRSSH